MMTPRQTFKVVCADGTKLHVVADDPIQALNRCIGWGIAKASDAISVSKDGEILVPQEDTHAR